MGRRNDVAAVQLANALCSRCACVDRSLDRADIAAHHNGNEAGADLLLADEMNVGRLDHGVGRFHGADQAAGFHHTEC